YVGYSSGATGVFNYSGGTLRVDGDEIIAYDATGNATRSGGAFIQTNVQHEIDGSLYVGRNNGSTGTFSITNGTLTSNSDAFIGYGGTGTFTSSASTHTLVNPTSSLYLGRLNGGSGTYNLNANSVLTVHADEYVGYIGNGVFHQNGGENNIGGD